MRSSIPPVLLAPLLPAPAGLLLAHAPERRGARLAELGAIALGALRPVAAVGRAASRLTATAIAAVPRRPDGLRRLGRLRGGRRRDRARRLGDDSRHLRASGRSARRLG